MNFFNFRKKEKREAATCPQCENEYSSPTPLNFLSDLLKNQKLPEFLSAFFCALELISNTIAQLPLYITNKKDEETSETQKMYDNLFNKNLLNKFNLIKNFITDLFKKGNGFLYIERESDGKPVSLRYLDANDVNIRYIKKQNIIYYTCPELIKGQILMEDMIHIFKNTTDGVTGKPISFYAGDTLKLAGLSEKQAQEFFSSGCNISGILTYSGNLSEKQKNEIRDNWALTHQNGKSGLAVLGGGMNYQQIGANSKDSQLLESRTFDIESIARYFNINPSLIGSGKVTYNTLEQSQLQLLMNCIRPILILIEEEFNRKLYPGKYYIHFDDDAILRTDKQSEANYYTSLVKSGLITPNEARKAMGWDKVDKPEMDEFYALYTDLNQNKLGNNNDSKSLPDNGTDSDNKEGEDEKIDNDKDE